MNPLHLRAASYRSFESLYVDLPDGCVAILGEVQGVPGTDSNGAGKTSLLEAIEISLFGRRSLAPYQRRGTLDDLLLELEFEHAGETYRVRRTFSARGRGKTTLDFEIAASDEPSGLETWEPLTCESAKATQQRIEQTIGLSQLTWRNSSYLRQRDGSFADASLDPAERKRILGEVLGLDRYDRLRDRARTDLQATARKVDELNGRTQAARELADTRAAVEADHGAVVDREIHLADQVADLDRARAAIAERWQAAREQAAHRQACEAELAQARDRLGQLQRLGVAATEAMLAATSTREELATLATPAQLDQTGETLAALQRSDATWRSLVADRETAVIKAGEARRRRDELLVRANALLAKKAEHLAKADALEIADHATCQTCGQQVDGEARERAIASFRTDADTCEREASDLAEQVAAIALPEIPAEIPMPTVAGVPLADALVVAQRTFDRCRADQAQRARLEERLVALQVTVAARPAPEELADADQAVLARERMRATLDPVDIEAIEREGVDAARKLKDAQALLAAAQGDRIRLDERLAQIVAADQLIAEAAVELAALQAETDLLAALERAFGANGIQALILENVAIPAIEADANRILGDLGCPYTVELRTQAALKTGDGVRDTLQVIVVDEAGDESPFEECTSGGEKTRIGLALRIGLARLLAHRRGSESRLLALDEPGDVDEAGMAAIIEALRGLQGDFDKVYLVSHVPALRDSFDTVLTVVKDPDGCSRILEAGVPVEAVEVAA